MASFVFDTYAILEIISGNPNYAKYLDSEIIINDFIFAELCYKLIRESGLEKAGFYISKYSQFRMNLEAETIKEAMHFRALNKKKNFSATDCIGYMMALRSGIRFLTGDKEFEGMKNVEFVR